ncbi:hypothetical protein [Geminicoccus flavidas]|uniref:hypothetical protein n=1 Tax=Geminicoccus flavidas TaxID=2506407 RepID=UPI00190F5CE7|nr:hypothetical protein [Geminicoccus flavidas]
MNASLQITIAPDFLRLKLDELFFTHEQREAQKRQRVEVARLAREETRLLRERAAAESREAKYAAMLLQAKHEAAAAS